MARANFVKSARKPIYTTGLTVTKIHVKGKDAGKEYTDLDRSQPRDEQDKIFINIGESYYWWQFKGGGVHISRTQPKASQLTQNPFLGTWYELTERVESLTNDESLVDELDAIKSDVEQLRDEQQEKMDNMPENLQNNCPAYEILEERYNGLEELCNELDSVDIEEWTDEDGNKIEDAESVSDIGKEERESYLQDKIQEISDAFGNVSF